MTTQNSDRKPCPTFRYLEALLERHLRDLKFSEVTRALRALSVDYVEKREQGGLARALDGRGKRAAFALYYGASHFLAAQNLIREFDLGFAPSGGLIPLKQARCTILDLGCGTGICGAAWALDSASPTAVLGVDRSSFSLHEARWTYQTLGVRGETARSIAQSMESIQRPSGIVIGWTLNELDDDGRGLIAGKLLPWVMKGTRVLAIEPVSKRVAPWWEEWTSRFPAELCSVMEKRLRLDLPTKIALLGRSAGLTTDTAIVRVLTTRPKNEPHALSLDPLSPRETNGGKQERRR